MGRDGTNVSDNSLESGTSQAAEQLEAIARVRVPELILPTKDIKI